MSEEAKMLQIMKDPVQWAEKHLTKPRWYQEQILRHPHHRIVLRCGRRLGKCIAGDQRMVNPQTGEYETIDQLFKEQVTNYPVFSLEDDLKIKERSAFYIEDNGMKETFTVKTKRGSQVVLTGNHPVLTIDGWKEVDALRVGEFIATPKAVPVFGEQSPGLSRAKMLGYITGGYSQTKFGPVLRITSEDNISDIEQTAKQEGIMLVRKTKRNFLFLDTEGNYLKAIEEMNSRVPKEVYTYDKTHLAVFLAAFYDINGWSFAKRIAEVGFGAKEKDIALDIKHLLLRFGIDSNLLERKVQDKPYHQLMMYAKPDLVKFVGEIGRFGLRDYTDVLSKATSMTGREFVIPSKIWEAIDEERKKKHMTKAEVTGIKGEKFRPGVGLSEEKAHRYAENLQMPYLHDLATSDIHWQEVTYIIPSGIKQTYDVYVPETHNLVVEDILVHNTWTMAAHIMWGVFTNYGGTVEGGNSVAVVATPYDSQAKLIFDQLREFIDGNEILKSSVKSITKSPYHIEFKNGSKIKLFTAGTKNGSGGASLRGQKADSLVDNNLKLHV